MAYPSNDRELLDLVRASPWHWTALQCVASIALPDSWIGAGFVRSPVWDSLHGFKESTPLADVDVVFFDPHDQRPEKERALEIELGRLAPNYPWSVRNQARMHLRNGEAPYRSTADAICHWLETPTAVAVRMTARQGLELLAPLGTADLLELRLRPTPHARQNRLEAYRQRIACKAWSRQWPKLKLDPG